MDRLIDDLTARYDWRLALLVVLVSFGGMVLSRLMSNRARHARAQGFVNLCRNFEIATSVTVGLSVWSAHLLVLQAQQFGAPVAYDLSLTVLSLALGMAATVMRMRSGLVATTQAQRLAAAAVFCFGLAAMHVVGMAGMRGPGAFSWSVAPLVLGVLLSLGFAFTSVAANRLPERFHTVVACVFSALSVCALYFVSLAGVTLQIDPGVAVPSSAIPGKVVLGWVVAAEVVLVGVAAFALAMAHWSRTTALGQVREAMDAMSDGLSFFDADDRLTVWNARYAELNPAVTSALAVGMSFRQILQIGLDEGLYAEARGREQEFIAERMAARKRLSGTLEQHITGDRWLRIQDRRTAAGGVVTVCTDITDLKRDAQALAEARDAAESANRAKSAFLANMSHEIRTPLNGVIGLAQALDRTELKPEQRDMLNLIQSSGLTLQTLLTDILDLARIEAGRLSLSNEPFDLRRAVGDAAGLYAAPAAEKGLRFVVEAPENLAVWVEGDVVRLKQVLTNLVSNAVKFTNDGSVSLTVSRRPRADGAPELCFTVQDTGIGFDADAKARLFDRFEQADGGITRRFGGSGLGLAICRQLAAMMGGDLDCESEPGVGSAFTLTLPLREVAAPVVLADAASGESDAEGRPLKVLLADDHPTNRKVVELILSQAAIELTSVEDGLQAVAAYRAGTYDVILMDMQMPVMDGLTATREIRLHEAATGAARTPVAMLTGNALPEHVAAGQAAGADRHLAKPFNAAELIDLIGELADERWGLAA